jgi:hypothetical protein
MESNKGSDITWVRWDLNLAGRWVQFIGRFTLCLFPINTQGIPVILHEDDMN